MSERSIYLRDQAAKCERHAKNIGDSETQQQLRKLADEYVEQAGEIEARELSPIFLALSPRRRAQRILRLRPYL
jgi:hypothetical protein